MGLQTSTVILLHHSFSWLKNCRLLMGASVHTSFCTSSPWCPLEHRPDLIDPFRDEEIHNIWYAGKSWIHTVAQQCFSLNNILWGIFEHRADVSVELPVITPRFYCCNGQLRAYHFTGLFLHVHISHYYKKFTLNFLYCLVSLIMSLCSSSWSSFLLLTWVN